MQTKVSFFNCDIYFKFALHENCLLPCINIVKNFHSRIKLWHNRSNSFRWQLFDAWNQAASIISDEHACNNEPEQQFFLRRVPQKKYQAWSEDPEFNLFRLLFVSPVCERSHGFSNALLLKYCIIDYLIQRLFPAFSRVSLWPCLFGVLPIRGHGDLVDIEMTSIDLIMKNCTSNTKVYHRNAKFKFW